MRWIFGAACLLAAFGCASLAAGYEPGPAPATACPCNGQYGTLAAPACAGSFYGMVPGCCQCPPSACDNAWDGYCQEKARWKAFWYRVGTGSMNVGRHGGATYGPACESCATATQPGSPAPAATGQPASLDPPEPPMPPDPPAIPADPSAAGQPASLDLPEPPMPPDPPAIPADPAAPAEPSVMPPLPGPVPEQAMLRWPTR